MTQFEPCPFCGAGIRDTDAHFFDGRYGDGTDVAYVKCPACGIHGPVRESTDDAIAAWNHRGQEGGK